MESKNKYLKYKQKYLDAQKNYENENKNEENKTLNQEGGVLDPGPLIHIMMQVFKFPTRTINTGNIDGCKVTVNPPGSTSISPNTPYTVTVECFQLQRDDYNVIVMDLPPFSFVKIRNNIDKGPVLVYQQGEPNYKQYFLDEQFERRELPPLPGFAPPGFAPPGFAPPGFAPPGFALLPDFRPGPNIGRPSPLVPDPILFPSGSPVGPRQFVAVSPSRTVLTQHPRSPHLTSSPRFVTPGTRIITADDIILSPQMPSCSSNQPIVAPLISPHRRHKSPSFLAPSLLSSLGIGSDVIVHSPGRHHHHHGHKK